MRILLRADASPSRGTGHVMRCLTLGEELRSRGHEVELAGHIEGVPWLEEHLAALGMTIHALPVDSLEPAEVLRHQPDRIVVDSYWIAPDRVTELNASVPVLAIVDHDTRGIGASWYLDHNLGAEDRTWPSAVAPRMLAGNRYALVRSAIVAQRRPEGWLLPPDPSIVAFMGGTDPFRRMTDVASGIARALPDVRFSAVTTADQVDAVRAATAGMPRASVLPPTRELPELLGTADVIVSAAGTSAWDVLTMGRPAVLVGVVDNQTPALALAIERGLALGLDAAADDPGTVGRLVSRLLVDESLRRRLVTAATAAYDGAGASRVSDTIERPPLA